MAGDREVEMDRRSAGGQLPDVPSTDSIPQGAPQSLPSTTNHDEVDVVEVASCSCYPFPVIRAWPI